MSDGNREHEFLSLRDCNLADLWLVCSKLRQYDIDEFLASTGAPSWNFETMAGAMYSKVGPRFCLSFDNGDPVACAGFDELAPGSWQAWLLGTEEGWKHHWRAITKGVVDGFDRLFESGARRIQIHTLESRKDAIRWYEKSLRMRAEGVWREYGSGGENFALYAVLKQEWVNGRRR